MTFLCVLLVPVPVSFSSANEETGQNQWSSILHGKPLPKPAFSLYDTGTPSAINYAIYGEFRNPGQENYYFEIQDMKGLRDSVGEGIFPNNGAIFKDPGYAAMIAQGGVQGSHWDMLKSRDLQKAFFVWSQAPEDPGVKTFFSAQILEKAGHILPALKAYYAALVHFPRSVCWAADHSFVWYIAPSAIGAIERLCAEYPDLNCALQGASFDIRNGEDTDLKNDIIKVAPGKIVSRTLQEKIAALPDLSSLKVINTRGKGRVQLVQFSNGHWQMMVDKKPYFIKGITYAPTEIGIGPMSDENFSARWMFTDRDKNGLIDAPYESWVDENNNGQKDDNEKAIGDFQLLKAMGVNTIRLYAENHPLNQYDPTLINKPLLRDMHDRFGVSVIIGDFLGAYTLGSGASWEKGTDYTDPEQRKRMKAVVRAKVMDLKDEPFVLMWILGNENNLPQEYMGVNASRTNAAAKPEAYATFLNEVAQMIHEIDKDHPVAVGNLELGLVEDYKKYAPAIDILGMNSYRGSEGFGSLFADAKAKFDRPVLVTEFGCDAYSEGQGIDEEGQLSYHIGNWHDLMLNKAGGPRLGNVIGGIVFEYLDEWWKAPGDPENLQATHSQHNMPFPDGYGHEEWFGIAGHATGSRDPLSRHLRKTYFYYKDNLNMVPQ